MLKNQQLTDPFSFIAFSLVRGERFTFQAFFFGLILMSFCLPIHDKLVPPLIIYLVLIWLLDGKMSQKFRMILRKEHLPGLLALSGFFFVYVAGLMYTDNLASGLIQAQLKLPLLIFPVIIGSMGKAIHEERKLKAYILSYLTGCLISSLWLILNSLGRFAETGLANEFYYVNLAGHQHASYLSMYLNLAIVMIGYLVFHDQKRTPGTWSLLILAIYFGLLIILLSSKAGILTLFLVLSATLTYLAVRSQYLQALTWLTGGALLILITLLFLDQPLERFKLSGETMARWNSLSPSDRESTAERILIWQSSLPVLEANVVSGTGTGDVQDQLQQAYQQAGLTQAFNHRLNAHNQYLQTFLAIGVTGLMMLLSILLFFGIWAIRKGHFLLALFLLIIGFNFMFESMLCRQGGVVFFGFFYALLLFQAKSGGTMTIERDLRRSSINTNR